VRCSDYFLLSQASRTLNMANCLLWQLSVPAASTLLMRLLTQCALCSFLVPILYHLLSAQKSARHYLEQPKELRESTPIQLPVVREKTPTTNHKDNVQNLFSKIFYSPVTLADIGISEQRKELTMQAIAEVWTTGIYNPGENGQSLHDILFAYLSQTPEGIKLRQQGEKQQALEHARERLERAVKGLKDKIASENEVVRQIYKQITPTFDPRDDGIWSEIDLLEGDPMHRGVAMRNPRHKPFWLRAEGDEWQGLWEKGTFKKWNRSDLLPNDRVFTSRYVYKIKRSAKTGEAYRFKARMIVRGFEWRRA
jgi:hypothetical protein